MKETCEILSIWQRSFAKHLLQLSSEEQILFGTPKYSEFHRTAPLEETGGKAWVLFYNMHTVSDLKVNLHRYFKITLFLINVSVLNFVDAFCLNIRAGSVIGRSLCKTQIKSPNTSKCGEFVENICAACIALQLVYNKM